MAESAAERIARVIDETAGAGTPLERARVLSALLEAWPELHARAASARRAAFVDMRERGADGAGAGMSDVEIGRALGVARERAWQVRTGRTAGAGRAADDASA